VVLLTSESKTHNKQTGLTLKKLFIGTSWKMNKLAHDAEVFAKTLAADLPVHEKIQPFIIPPFPYIQTVSKILADSGIWVGAQNMHWKDEGAWTGEISAPMIKDCGATLVELGHSERRAHFGETDETVALKVASALRHGLTPLVCIGDTKAEYDADQTQQALARQTTELMKYVDEPERHKIIVAYEPVWSIGEFGTPASPEFAEEQHSKIKLLGRTLGVENLRVLYGGSVNRENCVALAAQPNIDGLFIGRAAWQAEGYLSIIKSIINSRGDQT
jgi:L-erythrulose 1-phosphate isomerase